MLPHSMHQLSIRHMTETAQGEIWFGGQYEGTQTDTIALVGSHKHGEDIALLDAPETTYRNMRHYIGSVASTDHKTHVVTTSPRGGYALIWDIKTRSVVDIVEMTDVCGAASNGQSVFLSDGRGGLWDKTTSLHTYPSFQWDNHLSAIDS
jgi:hypothetical protein